MKIAFTICSINYLAQAKTLGDSLLSKNPDYQFYVGLVDVIPESFDTSVFEFPLLEVHKIGIAYLDEMWRRYSIVEFNTAVKPFFFQYFFEQHRAESVIYFDPDIFIYQPITHLDKGLDQHDIIITSHVNIPTYNPGEPTEESHLNYGIYNLGFIAIRKTENSSRFLEWWQVRLKDKCFADIANGLYVDQLWVNFAPVFFDRVLIDRHMGLNMAYWNLHERKLELKEGEWWVNDTYPLIFFHFSSYNPDKSDKIAKYTTITFDQRPDLVMLFEQYRIMLQNNEHNRYIKIPCYYMVKRAKYLAEQKPKGLALLVHHLKFRIKTFAKDLRY